MVYAGCDIILISSNFSCTYTFKIRVHMLCAYIHKNNARHTQTQTDTRMHVLQAHKCIPCSRTSGARTHTQASTLCKRLHTRIYTLAVYTYTPLHIFTRTYTQFHMHTNTPHMHACALTYAFTQVQQVHLHFRQQ